MKRHIGSTIALIFGVLSVLSGLAQPSPTSLIIGVVIILGALAYRSAKKRKLKDVKTSWLRYSLEIFAILVAMSAVLLQKNLANLIETDPASNLIIPLWVLVAYIAIQLQKPK